MKKSISSILIIVLLFSLGLSCFADFDFQSMTMEELSELQAALDAEILRRQELPDDNATQVKREESAAPLVLAEYTGNGDDIIILDKTSNYFVFKISGNEESRYFGVTAYDENGKRLGSLVNTTDKYNGCVIDNTQTANTLEIKASGAWAISVCSISSLRQAKKGMTISGTGDDIFVFDASAGECTTAFIEGNSDSRYFGITGYEADLQRISSFVNTTDAYSGRVMLKRNPRIFEIKAIGDWSITFE